MFDTVILLTGSAEQEPLASALKNYNPQLTILPARILADLQALEPHVSARARLIAFATTVIVPGRILNRLGFGAYNFHPGPPNYPGWAPSHFAVYDRATSFGVTAHGMLERVDSGPIIAVDLFDIPVGTTAESLEAMAYARLARQFFALAKPLATSPHAPPALPVQWCGPMNTRRRCAELCEIPPDISRDELERRMAAFGDGRLGLTPTVILHGRQFRYVGDETAAAAASAALLAAMKLQEPIAAVPA